MTKRLTYLILVLIGNVCIVNAQGIMTGRVIDNDTKKGVKDAQVKLESGDTTVVTNILGFFQLNADTSDHLLVSASNYESGKYKVPAIKQI